MLSKLEQIATTAVTVFLVLTNSGLGGFRAPEARERIAADSPRQELVKAGSKECPPGVPGKNHD